MACGIAGSEKRNAIDAWLQCHTHTLACLHPYSEAIGCLGELLLSAASGDKQCSADSRVLVRSLYSCVSNAGAGAAAAAADAAGYFRLELLRRLAMEFVMPWTTWIIMAARQQPGSKSNNSNNTANLGLGTPTQSAQRDTAGSTYRAHDRHREVGSSPATAAVGARQEDTEPESDQTAGQSWSGAHVVKPLTGSSVLAVLRSRPQVRTPQGVPLAEQQVLAAGLSPALVAGGQQADISQQKQTDGVKGGVSQAEEQFEGAAAVPLDVLKPSFDPFTGIWDVTRDMG